MIINTSQSKTNPIPKTDYIIKYPAFVVKHHNTDIALYINLYICHNKKFIYLYFCEDRCFYIENFNKHSTFQSCFGTAKCYPVDWFSIKTTDILYKNGDLENVKREML